MSKNVILIFDSCQSFVNGFKKYVDLSEDDEVIVIHHINEINDYKYDFLLIGAEASDQIDYPDNRMYILTFGEDAQQDDGRRINRYTKASQILSRLKQQTINNNLMQKRCLIFSMSGGSGKTLLANGLCRGLEDLGQKSLHLSFAPTIAGQKRDIDLSLLIYYLGQQGEIPESIKRLFCEKLASTKNILSCGLNAPEDVVYLTPEVLHLLFKWLDQLTTSRVTVMETTWTYGNELQVVLQHCHYRLMVSDERHSLDEVRQWRSKYEQLCGSTRGFYSILNKRTDQPNVEDGLVLPQFDIKHRVKEAKEWTCKYLLTHWIKE